MNFSSFHVGTCEARVTETQKLPFAYSVGSPYAPFDLSDPFGLRTAVVPVFMRDPDGRIFGMGTAFHFDGWGGFLTADHVVDFSRETLPHRGLNPRKVAVVDPAVANHVVLMLGVGLVFGTFGIPKGAMVPVESIHAMAAEDDNPMAALSGGPSHKVIADLAKIQVRFATETKPAPSTLPIRLTRWQPKFGEQVLAIGFPGLNCEEMDDVELRSLISEGMCGAYGRITGFHPAGRDRANPTPVFEVEAEWPPGMSGGPVFNRQGEVVGVVSRSLLPDGSKKGVGYAACLPAVPRLNDLLPTLDPSNPGWRRGYGVICKTSWRLAAVRSNAADAHDMAAALGADFEVCFGRHRIGADDFVFDS